MRPTSSASSSSCSKSSLTSAVSKKRDHSNPPPASCVPRPLSPFCGEGVQRFSHSLASRPPPRGYSQRPLLRRFAFLSVLAGSRWSTQKRDFHETIPSSSGVIEACRVFRERNSISRGGKPKTYEKREEWRAFLRHVTADGGLKASTGRTSEVKCVQRESFVPLLGSTPLCSFKACSTSPCCAAPPRSSLDSPRQTMERNYSELFNLSPFFFLCGFANFWLLQIFFVNSLQIRFTRWVTCDVTSWTYLLMLRGVCEKQVNEWGRLMFYLKGWEEYNVSLTWSIAADQTYNVCGWLNYSIKQEIGKTEKSTTKNKYNDHVNSEYLQHQTSQGFLYKKEQ